MRFSKLVAFLDRNLGRCPRCMKAAFLCAAVSWPMFFGLSLMLPGVGFAKWFILAPIGFTALWLAHVATYAGRVYHLLRAEYLGDVPFFAQMRNGTSIDRRRLLGILGTAAGVTVVATVWLPKPAFAAGHPCGSGKVCPDDAPNCCSHSHGKCCNGNWACVPLGKCYNDHASARKACGPDGTIWACV